MPQRPSYLLTVELTEAELRALRLVLEYFSDWDETEVARLVGNHHSRIQSARRMYERVGEAIVGARRLVNGAKR